MVERLSTMGIASRQTLNGFFEDLLVALLVDAKLSSTEGKESEGKLVVKMKEELFLPKDDRGKISELPDNILLHMMDFMDTREAVQTCVLSKRWNNLWKLYGAGSAVKSKVSGTEKTSNVGVEQDKGVSVKDYLVDKLRPGDDDRALSKVISENLHKKEVHPVEITEEGVRKMGEDIIDVVRWEEWWDFELDKDDLHIALLP
ncbi:hypothetical protein JHK87_025035 [Glycine soja]|nr:hypothetical protein JHK87_025035 [Glycine soja]